MNVLIIILTVIASLIALLLILALFAKKAYSISREISIHKPKQQVFDYVRMLKNQDHYSKWVMTDPNKKTTFRGIDGTVGFVYAWDGNKQAGAGEHEIKKIKDGERLESEVRFVRPFAGTADLFMSTSAIGDNQTLVKWGFSSKMKYPLNVMLLLMNMEKMMGKDMEISLQNLKKIMEK